MKILHAREIYTGIEVIQQTLKTTYEQVSEIERAVEGIIQLEDSLKGKGGEAIRAFFQNVHKPFLLFHQAFITDYDTILAEIKYLLQSFEPAEDGFIHESFLENDVANGLDRLERRVTSITGEINNAIHSVQDIVSLPTIHADETISHINQARQHNRMTIENLHSFDEQATRLLDRICDDLLMMASFMKEIETMTQSSQLPISHDSVSKMMTSEAYRKLLGSLVKKVGLEPINTVERDPYGNDNSIKYHVYADGLIVMEADRSGKVHYEVVPAIPEEIRDGAITSPVDRAFEGVIDGMGKALGDTIDGLVSLYKFSEKNLQPGNINYIEKAIFAYQLIHDPKKKLGEMKDKVINFPKYMWEGMKNAWNRDVINGDAHSRAEFFSYGLTTIGIGVIGDKGLSRAGQLGNVAKLSNIGKIGNVANKIPPAIPINKGLTPTFATGKVNTIPYNVMDDLYNRIHQASKEAFGDSRDGKVSRGVGETSNKVTGVIKRTQKELDDLARDPAHGGNITKGSELERDIGLALEKRGNLGHIIRDKTPQGGAEFIDKVTGKKYDVKSFESYPNGHTSPKKGAFTVNSALKNIQKELDREHDVIINTTNLTPEHTSELINALKEKGWINRIIFYP